MKKRRAFTLVELIVACVIALLVMGMIAMIFWRSRKSMATATARQILKRDARVVLTHLVKDLAAAKRGTLQGTTASFAFDRYLQVEEGAKPQTLPVQYSFSAPFFKKNGHMLSMNVESCTIRRGAPQGQPPPPTLKEPAPDKLDRTTGTTARIDIELVLARKPAGVKKIQYHAERTSVFMREEYSFLTSKAAPPLEDLSQAAAQNQGQVLGTYAETPHFAVQAPTITAEFLKSLNAQQRSDLLSVQEDGLERCEADLDDLNDKIGDLDDGYSNWAAIIGGNDDDAAVARDLRNALEGAQTIEQVKAAQDRAVTFIKTRNDDFMQRSNIKLSQIPEAEREIAREAFEAKISDRLQWRTLKSSTANQNNNNNNGNQDPDQDPPPETIPKDDDRLSVFRYQQSTIQGSDFNTEEARQKALQKATVFNKYYDQCDLKWMNADDTEDSQVGSDDNDEVKAFLAVKSMKKMADNKIELLEQKKQYQDNITLIKSFSD